MDIDKLIHAAPVPPHRTGFSSLMDIDKLIPEGIDILKETGFSSLMDIDKLIPPADPAARQLVLVL